MTRDDGYTRYTVRIPTPLYERVKAAAGEKSVNAEIVEVLEREFPGPPPSASLLEAAVRDVIASDGWISAPAPTNAPYDILAKRDDFIIAIECKTRSKDLRPEQVTKLSEVAALHGVHSAYVFAFGDFSPAALQAADQAGVTLFDLTTDEEVSARLNGPQTRLPTRKRVRPVKPTDQDDPP